MITRKEVELARMTLCRLCDSLLEALDILEGKTADKTLTRLAADLDVVLWKAMEIARYGAKQALTGLEESK